MYNYASVRLISDELVSCVDVFGRYSCFMFLNVKTRAITQSVKKCKELLQLCKRPSEKKKEIRIECAW